MERVAVCSGLEGFVLLDSVSGISREAISGLKQFRDAPPWLVMESLAQLGALHVRYRRNFEMHAFLLGIKHCDFSSGHMRGSVRLCGESTAESSSAYSYNLLALDENGNRTEGEFLFSVVDYDDRHFKGDVLRNHYEKVFSCLINGSSSD